MRTPRGSERRVSAPFCSSTLKITPPTVDLFCGGSAGLREGAPFPLLDVFCVSSV